MINPLEVITMKNHSTKKPAPKKGVAGKKTGGKTRKAINKAQKEGTTNKQTAKDTNL